MVLGDEVNVGHSLNSQDTRRDYFIALEKWLVDAYTWENVSASVSYMLMTNEFNVLDQNGVTHRLGFPHEHSQSRPTTEAASRPRIRPLPTFPTDGLQRPRPTDPNVRVMQCRIPPIWKRIVAEFLDFLILFFLKLVVTFVAVDFFNVINLDKYGVQVLNPGGNINYKMVLAATSEILILEFIHRIVVCIFEVYWLYKGTAGELGGATPGKSLMGLRVLTCKKVENIENHPIDIVLVQPGTDLGIQCAVSRAILKNIILAVLFPLCFALFFFKHNRTGYDVVCCTIVVERFPRRIQ